MIYNSTIVYSQETLGNAYKLVLQQIAWVAVGIVGFLAFYKVDYQKLKKLSLPLFVISLIFLLFLALVNIFSTCGVSSNIFTPCVNGAYRWLYFNPPPLPALPLVGVLGFQPSEFAKFTLILYLAVILEKNITKKGNPFMVFLIITGIVSSLVLLEPNMSTAALIFLIGAAMYFVSGASLAPLLVSVPILGLLSLGFMFSSSYRRERLLTFVNSGSSGDLSLGYHIRQIQIALGTGGIFGVGFGQSRQKFQYLPEVAADSIFAIIGEEFGFIGTSIFVILFSALVYKGYSIAKNTKDIYSRLLAVGVTAWIAVQFFVNIAAMTRLIPLTGVPLPLVSYGGSSLVFSLMGLGLLANISSRGRV